MKPRGTHGARKRCADCHAAARARAAEVGRDHGFRLVCHELFQGHPQLEPLLNFWDLRPKLRYAWAENNFELLRDLAAGPITLERILHLPFARRGIRVLIAHLEVAGVLPQSALDIDEFRAFAEKLISPLQRSDALLLRQWARMRDVVLAVRRHEHGRLVDPTFRFARRVLVRLSVISNALKLQSSSFETMSQALFAQVFMPEGDVRKIQALRPFLQWLNKMRAVRLTLPTENATSRHYKFDFDRVARWVSMALSDASLLSTATRLYIIFALMYGQLATRIGRIQISQIGPDAKTIQFGDVWLELPDPVPELIREQLNSRKPHQGDSSFLFQHAFEPGRPVSGDGVCGVLKKVGVKISQLRPSALVALLKAVEYPLLARIIGMSESKLCAWANFIGSPSWDQYIAMRLKRRDSIPANLTIADRTYLTLSGQAVTSKDTPRAAAADEPSPTLHGDTGELNFDLFNVVV